MKYGFEDIIDADIRHSIRQTLKGRQKKNPRYSMRALARDLGINHSALSEILSGRRRISRQVFQRLVSRMKLPETESTKLLAAFSANSPLLAQMTSEEIQEQAQWYYPAILELTLTRDFKAEPEWIAQRLGLRTSVARKAILRLLETGRLRRTPKGKLVATSLNTTTLGQLAAAKQIVFQLSQFVEKQSAALRELPIESCSMMGLTVAMNSDDLPEVRKIIYSFIRALSDRLDPSSKRANEVYRLNVGFFPLTKTKL